MISKRNGVEEGSGVTNDDADSALAQGDTDYNPKEDEVIDGEEVGDCVVEKPLKVHIFSLFGGVGVLYAMCSQIFLARWSNVLLVYEVVQVSRRKKAAVKKTSRRKILERSVVIALRTRVMADLPNKVSDPPGTRVMAANPPGASKRMLEQTPSSRTTRQKTNMQSASIHTPLRMDREGSLDMDRELLPVYNETSPKAIKQRNRRDAGLEKLTRSLRTKKATNLQKTGSRSYAAHIYSKKEELKGEEISAIELFKATHHSKKFGYSVPVQEAIAEMESRKNALLPEGEPPKSDVEIVADVLKEKVKQSTFLMNSGLQSRPENNTNNAVVATHVRDLEEKLERSELQAEAMREEMAAIRKRAEDAEAAQAACDEELRLMAQEQNEKLAHLMALFGA
ncbi:unnamed protein product [Alopecurus aequalis]